jgi:hypothetical protein
VGLITGLLTVPLAPVRGLGWLAEQVQEQADREYEQRMGLQARLAAIEQARAAGEISTEEAVAGQERVLAEYWEDGRGGG